MRTLAENRQSNGNGQDDSLMSSPAQIGGYEWKNQIAEARMIKAEIRALVQKAIQHPDATLFVQISFKLSDFDDVINRLDEIGRNTKEIS
jgi:hypothetical protein